MAKKKKTPKKVVKKKPLVKTTSKAKAKKKVVAKSGWFSNMAKRPAVTTDQDGFLRNVFRVAAIVLGLLMILISQRTGINADDQFQNKYEQQLMTYYGLGDKEFPEDDNAVNNKTGMHLYGGVFEVVSGVLNATIGDSSPDSKRYHQIRHFVNALFGFFGMFFLALLAKEMAGWRAGILALIMIALSPRFLGHSFMNPKDIPFACGYIMAVYFMIRLFNQLPKPHWTTVLGLSGGIGIALGVRSGGLLLIIYLFFFGALDFLARYGLAGISNQGKALMKTIMWFIVASIGGVAIACIFWPYALANPITNIMESLSTVTNYTVDIKMLFSGNIEWAKTPPNIYGPKWMLLTVPLFSIVGWILFLVFGKGIFNRYPIIPILLIGFAFVFPFFYVIIKKSTLYDGWRHLIFAYAPGVVIASLAWAYLWEKYGAVKKNLLSAGIGLFALCSIDPAIFIIRNPTLSYTYFNPLAGGMKGAFGDYETDYWGVSVRQGFKWLEKQGVIGPDKPKIVVVSNSFYPAKKWAAQYGDQVQVRYAKYYDRYSKEWDYGMFISRFTEGSQLKMGTWPEQSKTVHTVKAGSIPVLAILKQDNNLNFKAAALLKQNNTQGAVAMLEQEAQTNPDNELAWLTLAQIYMQQQNDTKLLPAFERLEGLVPDLIQYTNMRATYHLQKNDAANAQTYFERTVKTNKKFFNGHFYLASILMQTNQLNKAEEHALMAIEYNPRFKQAYSLASQIYTKLGNTAQANQYKNRANQLK